MWKYSVLVKIREGLLCVTRHYKSDKQFSFAFNFYIQILPLLQE